MQSTAESATLLHGNAWWSVAAMYSVFLPPSSAQQTPKAARSLAVGLLFCGERI
jgi:hypothetical protein